MAVVSHAAPKTSAKRTKTNRVKASKSKVAKRVKRTTQRIADFDYMPKKGTSTGTSMFVTNEEIFRSSTGFVFEQVNTSNAIAQKFEYGISDTLSFGVQGQLLIGGEVRNDNNTGLSREDNDKELNNLAATLTKKVGINNRKRTFLMGEFTVQPKISKNESGGSTIAASYINRMSGTDQLKAGLNIINNTGDRVFGSSQNVIAKAEYQKYFNRNVYAQGELAYVNSSNINVYSDDVKAKLSPSNHMAQGVSLGYKNPKSNLSWLVSYKWSHVSTNLKVPGFLAQPIDSELNKKNINVSMGYIF